MSTKVLPGASRAAFSFLLANWQALLKMSALPFAAYGLLTLFQVRMLSGFYEQLAGMASKGQLSGDFFGAYMRSMALSSLGSLAASMLLGTLFVQIIRFQKSGNADWVMRDKAGWMAGVMTYLYGIGMMMLTLVAYLVAVFAVTIAAMLIAGLGYLMFGDGAAMAALSVLLMVAAFFAFVIYLYWFMFRFLVGLPGVALGHSPDFFRDIWPLAKGEGFGLPLRMLLATFIAYIPIAIVLAISGYLILGDSFVALLLQTGSNDVSVSLKALSEIMNKMGWLFGLSILVFMPFMWFFTLLLGEAFQRFRAKTTQAPK